MTRDEVKDWLRSGRDFKFQYITIDTCSKCTLQCPVCRRQTNKKHLGIPAGEGGKDIPVDDFIKLSKYFEVFSFCGAVSDPIFSDTLIECLKITENIAESHTTIHTAATAKHRTKDWYEKAFSANPNARWIFGLDGLPEESHKYRIGQNGPFLWEMMKLGVSMGIDVHWQYLVFRYNEDHVEIAYELAKSEGIKFKIKLTNRYESGQKPLNEKWQHYEIL